MSFNALNRKVHYWAGVAVALPVLVIIGSGLLLQLKKHWDWVQPPEQRGSGSHPAVSLNDLLNSVRAVPSLGVRQWDDVRRIDVRPSRGVAKLWLRSGHEVQIDLVSNRILHSAYRRSDLIETLHDGSFFGGEWAKLGLFLPSGIVLLVLWASGLWMFWVPFAAKRRQARRSPHL